MSELVLMLIAFGLDIHQVHDSQLENYGVCEKDERKETKSPTSVFLSWCLCVLMAAFVTVRLIPR